MSCYFPRDEIATFLFYRCLERCRFDEEDSKDEFLSMGGKFDGVLEAEEKRGRSYLAAVLVNTRPNQLAKNPICTLQY